MSISALANALLVAFGVGLVIFVHELGHYLAARWAGAKVDTFSIGIGPKLFGWRRGDTIFQVAALPLGGFVKLAGEYPEGGRSARPGELGAMSVFHRFVYYSGGVVMNVVFALVVMPLVLFVGLEGIEPVLGDAQKGTPAWHARIEPGSRVVTANGNDPFDFFGLATEVALSGRKPVALELEVPTESGPRRVDVSVPTEYDEDGGVYRLGVQPALDERLAFDVRPGTAAAKAGLTAADGLVAVVGQPEWLAPVRQLTRAVNAGGPITLRVADAQGAEREVTIAPEVQRGEGRKVVGVSQVQNKVAGVRKGPDGADGPAQRLGIAPGDRVLTVGGRLVLRATDFVDALVAAPDEVVVRVQRGGEVVTLKALALTRAERLALDEDVHLESDPETSRVLVQPGLAAARAGLADGDRVMSVDGVATGTWDEVFGRIRARVDAGTPIAFEVWRDEADATGAVHQRTLQVSLTPAAADLEDHGVVLAPRKAVHRAESVGDALRLGVLSSWRFLANTWLTLKKMLFTDEVSTKNLGGIITISVVSFHTANEGLAQLFFLLAIISVNLAILNLLPIPILDGGHLVFLLVEWVKGSPVSERTLGYSQVVGLVILLSLMIYVTYQDVVRWILPG